MGHSLGDHSADIQALWVMAYLWHSDHICSMPSQRAWGPSSISVCQHCHRCPRKAEGCREGAGRKKVEGHRPHPLKGDQSWPTSSFPGAFKAFKDISGSDHCRECPKQSWKKSVTLAPAAPETRQPGYPKSRNKHFISTLQPNQETKVQFLINKGIYLFNYAMSNSSFWSGSSTFKSLSVIKSY